MTLPNFTSKAFLAPMAGVSDAALRLVCKELGAGLVVTEFVNTHAIEAKQTDITKFIEFSEKERPLSCQLFGSNLESIKNAIKVIEPHFDILDYNMGCPAPHITSQMAGAALLQKPQLTRKIFQTLVKHSSKPITVKIRAGVDKPDQFLKIGKMAQEEGLEMITLHARTLKQGYSGSADLSLIKQLKQAVNIKVCGNGDIQTPQDAKTMLKETNCDYVMIGRGAAKNPFLFKQINSYLKTGKYKEITDKDRFKYFFRYLKYTRKYPNIKVSSIRMQAMNFSKGCKGSKELRGKLLSMKNLEDIEMVMQEFYEKL
jgi:tRNA-dihydrouridine synthase B